MEDAEDALQTLFLRLLAQERPLDLSANAKGYLHRAAVNLALDAIRARKRRAAPIDAPAPRSDNQALQDSVRVALGRLKPKAAEIFALRYLEGYSNGEIATMIGTSPSVIAVTLFRTRIRLKRMIRYQLRGKWGSS
jgi:RNA polymerase sigma-70 factor (ECF subfamily)